MKHRSLAFVVLLSLVFGFAASMMVTQRASAACYDALKNEIPCPKEQKKAPPTPYPTKTPVPPTNAPVAVQSIVIATPNPDQLKAYCAGLVPPAGANGGAPGSTGNTATGPGGGAGSNGLIGNGGAGFLGPITMGIGGLLVGVLIGLLLPAVMRKVNGDGRGIVGPDRNGNAGFDIFTNAGDKWHKADKWDKDMSGGYGKMGDIKMQTGGYSKQGEAGAAVDMFQKASPGSVGGGGGPAQKLDDAGLNYSKQGGASMGDASVRPGSGNANLSGNNTFNGDGNLSGPNTVNGDGISGPNTVNGDGIIGPE